MTAAFKMKVKRLLLLGSYTAILQLAHYFLFLSPMTREAEEMNIQQIDPTDIVLIPYDLTRLLIYVTLIVAFLTFSSCLRGNCMYHLLQAGLVALALMILAGTSPVTHILHTALSAFYCAALSLSDPPIVVSSTAPMTTFSEHVRYRLRGLEESNKQQAIVARACSQGTIAGTVVLQILRLYDRGWQVQRWPVPGIMGSTIGWTVGAIVGTLWIVLHQETSRLEQKLSEKD